MYPLIARIESDQQACSHRKQTKSETNRVTQFRWTSWAEGRRDAELVYIYEVANASPATIRRAVKPNILSPRPSPPAVCDAIGTADVDDVATVSFTQVAFPTVALLDKVRSAH